MLRLASGTKPLYPNSSVVNIVPGLSREWFVKWYVHPFYTAEVVDGTTLPKEASAYRSKPPRIRIDSVAIRRDGDSNTHFVYLICDSQFPGDGPDMSAEVLYTLWYDFTEFTPPPDVDR